MCLSACLHCNNSCSLTALAFMNRLVPRSYSAYYTPTAAQQEAARQVSAAGELYLVHGHGHTGEMAVPRLARCSCRPLLSCSATARRAGVAYVWVKECESKIGTENRDGSGALCRAMLVLMFGQVAICSARLCIAGSVHGRREACKHSHANV